MTSLFVASKHTRNSTGARQPHRIRRESSREHPGTLQIQSSEQHRHAFANVEALLSHITRPQIPQSEVDVILLSSGEGLTNLLLLLSPAETSNFKSVGLIVPSERVADMARDAGFDSVVIAENASDEAMLRALQKWRPGNGE